MKHPHLMRRWLSPLLLSLAVVTTIGCSGDGGRSPLAPTDTVTVDKSGAGDFLTIQDAIDGSQPGTRIQVGAGTFEEHCVVAKQLTIVGSGSSTVVTVRGPKVAQPNEASDSGSAVLEIQDAADVVIMDITISNGPEDGISIRNADNITILRVNASDNGDDGLDIIDVNNVSVSESTFNRNGDKGAQVRDISRDVMFAMSEMSDNVGTGVRIMDSDTIGIQDSTVSSNGDGGIAGRDADKIEILCSAITNNAGFDIRTTDFDNVKISCP